MHHLFNCNRYGVATVIVRTVCNSKEISIHQGANHEIRENKVCLVNNSSFVMLAYLRVPSPNSGDFTIQSVLSVMGHFDILILSWNFKRINLDAFLSPWHFVNIDIGVVIFQAISWMVTYYEVLAIESRENDDRSCLIIVKATQLFKIAWWNGEEYFVFLPNSENAMLIKLLLLLHISKLCVSIWSSRKIL